MQFVGMTFLMWLITQDGNNAQIIRLVDKLRSNDVQERNAAARQLKQLGDETAPYLERAMADKDPEVSGIAKSILALHKVRASVSLELFSTMPAEMERIARRTSEEEWINTFVEAASLSRQDYPRYPTLSFADTESLLRRALLNATTSEQKIAVCSALAARSWSIRDSMPELSAILEDKDIAVRKYAADALANCRCRWAIPALMASLNTKNAKERAFYASALAKLGANDAIPTIVRLLEEPDSIVRRQAVVCLGVLGSATAVPPLRACLKDQDGRVREQSLFAIAALKARECMPSVLELLKDQYQYVRAAAAFAVGELGDKAFVSKVVPSLEDDDSLVRRYALSALRKLDARDELPTISKLLEHTDASTRVSALRVLGAFKASEYISKVLVLLSDDSALVGVEAANALGTLEAKDQWIPIAKLAESDRARERSIAVYALGQLGEPLSFPSIEKCLSDPDESVRAIAAVVAGELRMERSGKSLFALLSDPSETVRARAARSLSRIDFPGTRQALNRLSGDTNGGEVRTAAAYSLCFLGVDEQAALLINETKNGNDLPLNCLNAVRSPDMWKRLMAMCSIGTIECFVGTPFSRFAVQANIAITMSEDECDSGKRWMKTFRRSCGRNGRTSAILTLEEFLEDSPYDFILESDQIRIVTKVESVRFWSKWLRERERSK